jgi:hypothetical protein
MLKMASQRFFEAVLATSGTVVDADETDSSRMSSPTPGIYLGSRRPYRNRTPRRIVRRRRCPMNQRELPSTPTTTTPTTTVTSAEVRLKAHFVQ